MNKAKVEAKTVQGILRQARVQTTLDLYTQARAARQHRSDNGVPFASAHALCNLSKLAVWWLRLGIGIERMHLILKKEATKPAAAIFLQHQTQAGSQRA